MASVVLVPARRDCSFSGPSTAQTSGGQKPTISPPPQTRRGNSSLCSVSWLSLACLAFFHAIPPMVGLPLASGVGREGLRGDQALDGHRVRGVGQPGLLQGTQDTAGVQSRHRI